jgi:hypothetical protein
VLEYCAKSELHPPRRGLGMQTTRFVPRVRRRAPSGARLAREADIEGVPGSRVWLRRTSREADFQRRAAKT